MSYGTSVRIYIDGASMKELNGFKLSPIEDKDLYVNPPRPVNEKSPVPTQAMYAYQNQYRDFAFQKISPVLYGSSDCIARYTGIPANQPDFIADFHFIALMRIIDDMLRHRYKGTIAGSYNTPSQA